MSVISAQSVQTMLWELVSESCFRNGIHDRLGEDNQKKLEMYLVLLLEKYMSDPRSLPLLNEYLFLSYKDVMTTDGIKCPIHQVQTLADAALIRAGIFKRSCHTDGDFRLAQVFYEFVYHGKGKRNFFAPVFREFAFNATPYVSVLFDIRDEYIRLPRLSTLISMCQHTPALDQRTVHLLKKRGINILEHLSPSATTILQ